MSNLIKISKCLSFSNEIETVTSQNCLPMGMKILYEFWGFCVNGGTSVTSPGAIPSYTFPSSITGSIITGTDGVTQKANPGVFISNSAGWLALDASDDLVGKHLVMWKPNDESIDDSIYEIKGVNSEGHLLLNEDSGGGTVSYGNRLSFVDRAGIYFRVIDIASTRNLAWSDGQYMIISFSGSSAVNEGQENSQAQLLLRSTQKKIGIVVSPSGSWDGASFSDGTTEVTPASDMLSGPNTQPYYYVAASRDGLIMLFDGLDKPNASDFSDNPLSGIHIEIPKRLYDQELDPNPVMWLVWGQQLPSFESVSSSYYDGYKMVDHDGTVRGFRSLVRSPWGDSSPEFLTFGGAPWRVSATDRYRNFDLEQYERLIISSDVILSNISSSHFSHARCRLRFVRAGSAIQTRGKRHGRTFAHLVNGVILPWDNSTVSFGTFWGVK